MNLVEGAMLFQIPKDAGETRIKTAAITTASTGATGIIERHGQSTSSSLSWKGQFDVI